MKLKQLRLFTLLIVIACSSATTLFGQIPTTGLVAFWRMNGNFTDAGPNAVNTTNTGVTATTNISGAANSAMSFSNLSSTVTQYATSGISSAINFTGDFSIDFSFLFYGVPHSMGMYDNCLNYNGYGVWMWNVNGFPQIQFNYKNASVGSTAGANLVANTWYHITCVSGGGTIKIYINGILNNTGAIGSGVPNYSFGAVFGSLFYNGMSPANYAGFYGKLDEFRTYNRALSAAEIIQTANITLPLTMGNFTAVKNNSSVKLNWETLSELNTSHFEIQRSNDGINFTAIGNLLAKGNSTDKQVYSFNDAQPAARANFYRLKLVDIDGSYTYSRIIVVKMETSLAGLQLFPNPASDVLQLQLQSWQKETVKVAITDAAGKTVAVKNIELSEGNNTASIPVQYLQAGMYYLIIDRKDGRESKAFIKR